MKFSLLMVLITAVASSIAGFTVGFAQDAEPRFVIYDNMYYKGKPDTASDKLIASNTLYEDKIWPNRHDVGVLPSREAFEELVRTSVANPGPLVLILRVFRLGVHRRVCDTTWRSW
jgi:hypothetical protein